MTSDDVPWIAYVAEERRRMLAYFLQCFEQGNMTITGLDVTRLRWLATSDPVEALEPKTSREEPNVRKLEPDL